MKQFIINISKFLILAYIVLYSLEYIIDYSLKKENTLQTNTWHKIINNKINSDIIILGTSRAEAHYDTKALETLTKFKVFNLGSSGTHFDVLKIKWDLFLKHNKKPKLLILDVDDIALENTNKIFEKLQYLPYSKYTEYKSVVKDIDSNFYFEHYIPLYKYRGYETKILNNIKSLNNPYFCTKNYKGYVEHDKPWIEKDYKVLKTLLTQDSVHLKFDISKYNKGLSALEDIIEDCNTHGISMQLVWSPTYHEAYPLNQSSKEALDKIISQLSKKHKIPYHNFLKDSICHNKTYFYNSSHLNKKGVQKFIRKIDSLLQDELTK